MKKEQIQKTDLIFKDLSIVMFLNNVKVSFGFVLTP